MELIFDHLKRCLFGLQFFSRIPLPARLSNWVGHEGDLAKSAIYFPLVGLIMGLIPAFLFLFLGHFIPVTVAAGIAILSGVLISGGLHEDGLADCADGLGGGHTKDRALEIMKDSRIGTYGAITLVFSIGLRWAAITAMGLAAGPAALLIAHSVSRGTMTTAIYFSNYARKDGLGKSVSQGISNIEFIIVLVTSLLIAALIGLSAGLTATTISFAVSGLFLLYLNRRLDGYTGDGLGAMQQISEISILIVLSALWASN